MINLFRFLPRLRGRPGLAVMVAAALAFPTLAAAQGEVTETHGDWLIRCFPEAPEATPRCALTQYVVAEDRDGVGLQVLVWKGMPEGPALQVLAPLDIALRQGLRVRIDEEEIGLMNFDRCAPEGCLAQVLLDDRVLGLLRTGGAILFIFYLYDDPDAGIGVPISLAGFSAGFDALAAE